jgi:glucose-6-phosphate 1-dehydrogenase
MSVCLRSMTMDFVYQEHYRGLGLDAYARVLLDCMAGDHMLFWRQDGIEQSWAFLTPVLEMCEDCRFKEENLRIYPAGTWGPEQVRSIMSRLAED